MKKYLYAVAGVAILCGGIGIGYILFHRNVKFSDHPVEQTKPPEQHSTVDPSHMTNDEKDKYIKSPVEIRYTVAEQTVRHTLINLWAGRPDNYTESQIRVNHPVYEYNHMIGISAGVWYDSRAKPFLAPSYAHRWIGQVWIRGEVFVSPTGKFRGGSAGFNFIF